MDSKIGRIIQNISFQRSVISGLVGYLLDDPEIEKVIQENQYLSDLCKISINQLNILANSLDELLDDKKIEIKGE